MSKREIERAVSRMVEQDFDQLDLGTPEDLVLQERVFELLVTRKLNGEEPSTLDSIVASLDSAYENVLDALQVLSVPRTIGFAPGGGLRFVEETEDGKWYATRYGVTEWQTRAGTLPPPPRSQREQVSWMRPDELMNYADLVAEEGERITMFMKDDWSSTQALLDGLDMLEGDYDIGPEPILNPAVWISKYLERYASHGEFLGAVIGGFSNWNPGEQSVIRPALTRALQLAATRGVDH